MADFEEFSFDDSKIIQSLLNIKKGVLEIGEANDGVTDDMKKAFDDLGGSIGDIEAEMAALQAEVKNHIANARKAKSENDNLKKSFGDLVGDVRIFGVSLGGVVNQLKGKAQAMKAVTSSLGGTTKALQVFKVALISTGIGALVVLLGSLVAWFTKTQKGVDTVSKVLAGLGAVISVITDRITKIGGAIIKVFSGDFKGAFKDAKSAVSGLNDELQREIKLAVELEKRTQALREAKRTLSVETAQSRLQIKQLNLVVEDTTKSIKDRLSAAEQAGKIEQDLLEKRLKAEKEELQILLDKQALKDNELAEDSDEIAQARIQLANTEAESLELQTTLQNKKNGLLTEQAARLKEAAEAQKALRDELKGMVAEFLEQADALNRAQLDPSSRIKAEEELAIATVKKQFEAIKKKAKAIGEEVKLEQALQDSIEAIQKDAYKKQLELIAKFRDDMKKVREELFQGHDSLAEWEAVAKKNAEAFKKGFEDGLKNIKPVVAPVLELSSWQKLKGEIGLALGFGGDEEGREQFDQFAQAIGQTMDSVFEGLSTKINSQIDDNQAWIDDLKAKQDELADIIDLEKQRRDEGLAHNLGSKEEELAELKKKEEQALKEQAELRKKAATLQAIQDGAAQVSSLATAAAGIIKGFAEVPILGIALGIAAVASMFAAFASMKAKSKEAARGFEGGFLGDLLGPNASTEDEPHRGRGTYIHPDLIANAREYLVNGDSTMANFEHLQKLNAGHYDNVDLDKFLSNHSTDEIADGFSRRQGIMDGFGAIAATRIIRQTVRGEIASHTAAVIRAVLDKPEHIAISPGDIVRTYKGQDIYDMKT